LDGKKLAHNSTGVCVRVLQWIFLLIGIFCLGMYGFFKVQAYVHQSELETMLEGEQPRVTAETPETHARPKRTLREGDLFGRIEIPRLNMSVMVMEGVSDRTLRLGAGHIPGTPLGIAGHRDSFFRPLKDIKMGDTIKFATIDGTTEYHVTSTKIVGPKDTYVLDGNSNDQMTLVTCFPFYYIGSAPKRFIVEAEKNPAQN
jgi:sortase A